MLNPLKTLLASLPFMAFISLATPSEVVAQSLTVTLADYALELSYPQATRLDHILLDSEKLTSDSEHPQPFWLAAQWLEPTRNEEIELEKIKILENLKFLSQYQPDLALKAESIRNVLQKNQFNYRYFIPLDKDMVRLKPEFNPALHGHYTLLTPARSEMIFVVGAGQTITPVTLHSIHNPLHYLKPLSLPEGSDRDAIYIIQPDGHVSQFSNPIWQRQRAYLAPGAIILSGFASLPNEYAQLNQQIAELLRYMQPIQPNMIKQGIN
ncbi:capsule biosynthesis GfcC family protein [Vibrio sp. MA40-2]|uniref:capsule biosynthesis GfcC family protein n=1 Tax=Vibrio sp. MA40-2 TaxID=3391828 RepID=UPI0039A410C6